MDAITPVSRAEQALALATTPEQSKQVEAIAAAAKAWAKEQGDFELAFEASMIYIRARCNTVNMVEPTIMRGGDRGGNQYAEWQGDTGVTLATYDFTKKQWSRRIHERNALLENLDGYQDDCVEKRDLPTPKGLMGYTARINREALKEKVRKQMEELEHTMAERTNMSDAGVKRFWRDFVIDCWMIAATGDAEDAAEEIEFLKSDKCRDLCLDIGKRYDLIKGWLDMGCPTKPLHLVAIERFKELDDEPLPRIKMPLVKDTEPDLLHLSRI